MVAEIPKPAAPEEVTTHQRLRQEAAGLFARRGYGGTSMSEIAARVGVRKASLYNYYSSKEELLLDVLDDALAAWAQASEPAMQTGGSAERRLWEHMRAAVSFTVENPEQVAIVRLAATQIGGTLGRRVQRRLADEGEEHLEQMDRFFAQAIADGELSGEPRSMTLVFRVFLNGLLADLMFKPVSAGPPVDQDLPELWRCLWRGLSGRYPEETP